MNKTYKIIVSGRVQGVFFRTYAQKKAQELGLNGWVKNDLKGTVTVVAQGEEGNVKKLVKWCHEGSPSSRVESVNMYEIEGEVVGEYDGFEVKY